MPKKAIFTKEQIFKKAFEVFKQNGLEAITARNLAKSLNSSPAPIYSFYTSLDILKKDLINKAKDVFLEYVKKPTTEYIFLNIGIGVCMFAREEKQLFHTIFLKDTSYSGLVREFRDLIKVEMSKDSRFDKLDEEFKTKLFLDCWMYAHGFSTLIATNYFKDVSDDFIKERLVEGAATMLYKRLRDYNKKN